MKIDILCDSKVHPIRPILEEWIGDQCQSLELQLLEQSSELEGGNLLFLISCQSILSRKILEQYSACLVIHASDLPIGRGWSPHIWQILDNQTELTVSLIEANEKVDQGDIWHKICIYLTGLELYDEINEKLFQAEIELMEWAIVNHQNVQPAKQIGESTYYRRRTPEDSQLYLDKPLGDQFNLLRVSDPERYPAYVMVDGVKFKLVLSKDVN